MRTIGAEGGFEKNQGEYSKTGKRVKKETREGER